MLTFQNVKFEMSEYSNTTYIKLLKTKVVVQVVLLAR